MWAQAACGQILQSTSLSAVAPHLFTSADVALRESDAEWNAVAGALGVDRPQLRLVSQVHGAAVAVIRKEDPARPPSRADIVVTDDPAVAVAVRVADCAPILIADPVRRAVGAVHAGWRGTVQRAAQAGVEALAREFGSAPADLVAAIGPCLGPCCGEVGPEVPEAFRQAGHDDASLARWFTTGPTDRPYLDLWTANRDQLERAGVPSGSIAVAELCTRSHPDVFHSYRAAGTGAGRMVAAIRVRPD